MQQKNSDLKSSDDKKLNLEGMPMCVRDFFIDTEDIQPTPKEEIEEWKRKLAEFLENNKKNKD